MLKRYLFIIFYLFIPLLFVNNLSASSLYYAEVIVTESVIQINPYKDSSKIYTIKQGDLYPFIKKQNNFANVYVEGSIKGWIKADDVKIQQRDSVPTPSIAQRIAASSAAPYYNYQGQENYRFPSRSANQNFDLNTDGFVEVKASGRNYSPTDPNSPLWSTIINDPVYKKIPRDVLLGPIDIDTRSRISLEGKLSEDLYVYYDIEQEPEMPGKYDVEIKYKDHHLQFFHLNANYKQGNYINVSKSLRGAQYRYDDNYNIFQLSMGKERSESNKLENFGSGSKIIKLTHRYIFPGSVRAYVNNDLKEENSDYTVDYYEGVVTFDFPVEKTDYFKIIYEVSNPIADYLPVLARRNFQAIQYSGSARTTEIQTLLQDSITESFTYQPEIQRPSYPTFNVNTITIPVSENSSIENPITTMIDFGILNADLTLNEASLFPDFLKMLSLSLSTENVLAISNQLDLLFVETALFKEQLLNQYSTVQLFPDSFSSIEELTLKDSLDIFYALIDENILNNQGFIVSGILSKTAVFQDTSPFYFYNESILSWLKLYFLQKQQSSRPRFILKYNPIVLGSIDLSLNDIDLVINQDYVIDYSLGVISFLVPLQKEDVIDVSYRYYFRKSNVTEFIGKNTTGPYNLPYFPVIDSTVKILLNNKVLTELDDYIIDYDSGEIFFNYDIPYPSIFSVYYDFIEKKNVKKSSKKRPFAISAAYLNEFVPADEQSLSLSVVSENVSIVNGMLALTNYPLTNTENITISVDGSVISSENMIVSSNYQGILSLKNSPDFPAIESATSAIVSYEYLKSYRTKDSISPKNNVVQTTPYSIDGIDYILDYLPVKFNGVHYITYQGTKLQDESFSVSYLDDGSTIVITFYTSSTKPGSKLDTYPNGPFTIHFDYTPQEVSGMSDIKHHMFGTTLKGNITDHFSVNGEFVIAENNFGGQVIDFSMPDRSGNGQDNFYYDLGKLNIVENSEQIFLNDQSQTRDIDYIIIYKNGKFRFLNQTPGLSDVISADFQYKETQGVIDTDNKQQGYATLLNATYNTPSLNISGSYKYIDEDFTPIGSINESKGNTIINSSMDWDVSPGFSFSSTYSREKLLAMVNAENLNIYKHIDNFSTGVKSRLFNVIDSDHNFNYIFTIQDPDAGYLDDFSHDVDDLTVSYKGNYSFGPPTFRSNFKYSKSRQLNDYRDKILPKSTSTDSSSLDTSLNLSNRFFFKSIVIKPSYYQSNSNTLESIAPTSSFKQNKNFNLSSSFKPLRVWSFSPSYQWSNTKQQTASNADIAENKALSYGINSNYDPSSWFSTYGSYNHKEDESVLLNQQSNITNTKTLSIKRFTPYFGLISLGLSADNYIAKMLSGSSMSYSFSENDQQKNDRRNLSSSHSNRTNLTQLTLFKSLKLHNISFSNSQSQNDSFVESSSVSENHSISDTESFGIQLSYSPTFLFLKYLKYSNSLKNTSTESFASIIARSVTGNITEQSTIERDFSHSLNFSPPQLSIPNIFSDKKRALRLGTSSFSFSQKESSKNHRQISTPYLFSSQNNSFSRLSALTNSIDQNKIKNFSISSTLSPFNLFTMSGSRSLNESYYNRNISSTDQSFFQETKKYTSSYSISPFKFLSFSVNANQNRSTQWLMPTTNISAQELLTTQNATLSYTNKWNRFYSGTTTLKPFRFFSLSGSASYDIINQYIGLIGNIQKTSFKTETYTSSLRFTPIKSLAIVASYSLNKTNQQEGSSNSQSLTYTPIKTTYASVSIIYSRTHSTGFGINSIQLDNQSQADQTIGETKTVNRDHIVQNGSLNIDISLPINNAYVQKFTLIGEGYLKDIEDKLETPENPQSYSIFGLVLKGTLHF
jgi:hypothetical protein